MRYYINRPVCQTLARACRLFVAAFPALALTLALSATSTHCFAEAAQKAGGRGGEGRRGEERGGEGREGGEKGGEG